ncbi:hypothetical protein [Paraburkholderia nodosa]|uniref:hypothetical protein n=1 Tax=Paraburkholderia nodosa TaxID=392320 RepID=UPI000A6CF712|nr:hypothetical protein [Paraburkholderia nodosa]
MERDQLEHVIRAASAITQETEFVIVGSQSILGAFPDAPESLLQSNKLDIYPRVNWETLSDLIDGSIGEGSPFNEAFGYYAQGVDPRTAVLPAGWEDRLTQVATPATGGGIGYCIDVHDLAVQVRGGPAQGSHIQPGADPSRHGGSRQAQEARGPAAARGRPQDPDPVGDRPRREGGSRRLPTVGSHRAHALQDLSGTPRVRTTFHLSQLCMRCGNPGEPRARAPVRA